MRTTEKCKNCFNKCFLKECACGCGSIITERDSSGRLRRYKPHHQPTFKFPIYQGTNHYNWKGGRHLRHGYVMVKCVEHPKAIAAERYKIQEHRLTMERHLGRYLKDNEVVHHINGIKTDNRIQNLQLFQSHTEHMKMHNPKGKRRTEFWKKYIILRDKKTGRIVSVVRRVNPVKQSPL